MTAFKTLIASLFFCLSVSGALANDSVAEFGAGGLVLVKSGAISMEEETLYISANKVRVDYVFRNTSDRDKETIVAFPMPDLPLGFDGDTNIAQWEDNFLEFSTIVDGRFVETELEQRAILTGNLDITDRLLEAGIPVAPFSELDVTGVADDVLEELQQIGALYVYNERSAQARWTLRSTFYRTMTFPAGKDVNVLHQYTPATGGYFFTVSRKENADSTYPTFDKVTVDRYCMEDNFVAAVESLEPSHDLDGEHPIRPVWVNTLTYILTTGANWQGPIKRFRLIVDKGSENSLVSFCGTGVTKTGPTTFELVYEDYIPTEDLHVFFANPVPK